MAAAAFVAPVQTMKRKMLPQPQVAVRVTAPLPLMRVVQALVWVACLGAEVAQKKKRKMLPQLLVAVRVTAPLPAMQVGQARV